MYTSENEILFSKVDSEKMMQFEIDIAYFFGIKDPSIVSSHYIRAINELERLGPDANVDELTLAMIGHLEEAYQEIKFSTNLDFNVSQAARHELRLLVAQANNDSFDTINTIMIELYQEIFNTTDINTQKGAMLRTFLYKYKVKFLKEDNLSSEDLTLLSVIAKASENELNKSLK